jgi:hypothetical protein
LLLTDYKLAKRLTHSNAGSAHIYKYNGSTWAHQAFIFASDRAASDEFGCAVALSGNYAIVGAREDDDSYSGSGSAYIFFRDGDNWNQQAKLNANDPQADDAFGFSVAISEDYAFVGAYADDHDQADIGSVYIFKRSGTTWSQTQKLTPTDGEKGDYFGFDIAISNNDAVISSEKDNDPCSNTGSAYLYHRDGETWHFLYRLTAQDSEPDDYFGRSIAPPEEKITPLDGALLMISNSKNL